MMRRARGFTLLEVLLAVALLAAAFTLAFGILRAAGATVERGDALAQRNEHIRAVSNFLRTRLAGTPGIVFAIDQETGLSQRFLGTRTEMRFVADVPDYLGRGGPYAHTLTVVRDDQRLTLQVQFQMMQGGVPIPAERPPEPLADGLTKVEFAYRGLDDNGAPGAWLPTWTQVDALPLQVRVQMADARGEWPEVLVMLPLSGTYASKPQEAGK